MERGVQGGMRYRVMRAFTCRKECANVVNLHANTLSCQPGFSTPSLRAAYVHSHRCILSRVAGTHCTVRQRASHLNYPSGLRHVASSDHVILCTFVCVKFVAARVGQGAQGGTVCARASHAKLIKGRPRTEARWEW